MLLYLLRQKKGKQTNGQNNDKMGKMLGISRT